MGIRHRTPGEKSTFGSLSVATFAVSCHRDGFTASTVEQGGLSMKTLFTVLAAAAMLTLGCTPSDQAQPDAEVTPEAEEQITEMDFESGELDQASDGSDDPAAQPTPEAE